MLYLLQHTCVRTTSVSGDLECFFQVVHFRGAIGKLEIGFLELWMIRDIKGDRCLKMIMTQTQRKGVFADRRDIAIMARVMFRDKANVLMCRYQ